jgi:DNA-directed RNA polymerase subunit RPC12/RpoP
MYEFICSKCGGRSFSAAKLSTLKNPECPYCRSSLVQESRQVPDIARTAENDRTNSETKQVLDPGEDKR